jgi:hypothetical protein
MPSAQSKFREKQVASEKVLKLSVTKKLLTHSNGREVSPEPSFIVTQSIAQQTTILQIELLAQELLFAYKVAYVYLRFDFCRHLVISYKTLIKFGNGISVVFHIL